MMLKVAAPMPSLNRLSPSMIVRRREDRPSWRIRAITAMGSVGEMMAPISRAISQGKSAPK